MLIKDNLASEKPQLVHVEGGLVDWDKTSALVLVQR